MKVEGALFSIFWLLAYTMKFGMVWHDAGPPMGLPINNNWYFDMILAVYAVLGMYMWKAGDDPAKHKSLLGFLLWSTFAHGLVLVLTVIFDDTSSYVGPMMMGFELPATMMGVSHWQNLFFGDVPLMFFFFVLDAYLIKKAFGSFLFPWETL